MSSGLASLSADATNTTTIKDGWNSTSESLPIIAVTFLDVFIVGALTGALSFALAMLNLGLYIIVHRFCYGEDVPERQTHTVKAVGISYPIATHIGLSIYLYYNTVSMVLAVWSSTKYLALLSATVAILAWTFIMLFVRPGAPATESEELDVFENEKYWDVLLLEYGSLKCLARG